MLPQEIIRKKRDGGNLSGEEIAYFIDGLCDGSISSSQVSALAMAIFFQSMNHQETGLLTRAMVESGQTIDWQGSGMAARVVDKHSTGGVGDKVSLMLAPIVAACGAFVPMISGRGLGHTGGTLDKLESIPGYNATPDLGLFKDVVARVGCAIIGQTAELAPADRLFYAIRDVTATVESIPLITASILSKKIAAGLSGLCMDIKTGSGAFMASDEMALELAELMLHSANEVGLNMRVVISDMDQVLGLTAGNALEVAETADYLTGKIREPRLHTLVVKLAVEMLLLAGIDDDEDRAAIAVETALESGKAAEKFSQMLTALGGPADFLDRTGDYLASAPLVLPVYPREAGFVTEQDVRAIGNLVVSLGGGRKNVDDGIDHAVGLSGLAGPGTKVDTHTALGWVHARDRKSADAAIDGLRDAVRVGDVKPAQQPVIKKIIR